MAHASLDPHPHIVASGRSIWGRLGLAGAPVGLLLLTLTACLVRAAGLPAVQGTMGRDEARLGLAARGILEHGLPILPDGFLYTRGLLPAYLDAASFLLFGTTDQAARLSDLVFASLLVPAVYQLGRLAGGHRPAIAAALIVAFSPPLVLQAREAWLYNSFLLWLTLALGWLVRDGPGDRLRAGLAALAALFSHELAVLLVPVALLLDLGRAWHAHRRAARTGVLEARRRPPRPPLPALTNDGAAAHRSHRLRRRPRRRRLPGSGEGEPVSPPPRTGPWGYRGPMVGWTGLGVGASPGPGVGAYASSWRWRSLARFWAMLLAGVAVIATLSFALRAQTLGGPTVEFREYLRPTLDLRGLAVSLDILVGWYPWLLPVAALGLPLSRGGWRALLAGRGVAPSLLMLLTVIAVNSFGLIRRGESRYLLAAIPFLAVVAAVSLDRVGPTIVAALAGRPRLGRARHLTRLVLLTLLVAISLDPARLLADARSRAVSSTWVQALADRAPNDLIVSFAPTLTSHYLGRTDFWVRTEGYAKYVWAGRTPLRDVHTGAVLLRNQAEVERLLLAPNRGRTAWVVLAGDPAAETSRLMRELTQQLVALAAETRRPGDGRLVLRLQL